MSDQNDPLTVSGLMFRIVTGAIIVHITTSFVLVVSIGITESMLIRESEYFNVIVTTITLIAAMAIFLASMKICGGLSGIVRNQDKNSEAPSGRYKIPGILFILIAALLTVGVVWIANNVVNVNNVYASDNTVTLAYLVELILMWLVFFIPIPILKN